MKEISKVPNFEFSLADEWKGHINDVVNWFAYLLQAKLNRKIRTQITINSTDLSNPSNFVKLNVMDTALIIINNSKYSLGFISLEFNISRSSQNVKLCLSKIGDNSERLVYSLKINELGSEIVVNDIAMWMKFQQHPSLWWRNPV